MMIDPPIDKLVDKIGCKYALVIVTAKLARFLLDKKLDMLESTGENPISYAAKELYEGSVVAENED